MPPPCERPCCPCRPHNFRSRQAMRRWVDTGRAAAWVCVAAACALLWWLLYDEDGGRVRSVHGRVVVPVAVGGAQCKGHAHTVAEDTASHGAAHRGARLAQTVREVGLHRRRAVVDGATLNAADSELRTRLTELAQQGAVEEAWRVPPNPSVPLLLQLGSDVPTPPTRRWLVAVVEDEYLLVFDTKQFPEPALMVPIVCAPAERGVSAWNGAGLRAPGVWEGFEAAPDTRVVGVAELMDAVRPRPGDMAHPPLADVTHEGQVRAAALVETASYLLSAAEVLLATYSATDQAQRAAPPGEDDADAPASTPAAATPFGEVQGELAALRGMLGGTEDDMVDAIAALSTPANFDGALGGRLPFSFLPPVPNPAQQYIPTHPVSVKLPALPCSIRLLIANPSSVAVRSGAQFFFSAETEVEAVLAVSIPDGVCEVVDGRGGGSVGSGDDSEGDEEETGDTEGSSDEDEDEGGNGRLRHSVVCLVSTFDAVAVQAVDLRFTAVQHRPQADSYANTVDEAALKSAEADRSRPVVGAVGAQIANLCAQVKHVGGARFWITADGMTHDVEFALVRTSREGAVRAVDASGVVRGVVLTVLLGAAMRMATARLHLEITFDAFVARLGSVQKAGNGATSTTAAWMRAHAAALAWGFSFAVCFAVAASMPGSGYPLCERDVYTAWLPPVTVLSVGFGALPAAAAFGAALCARPALLLWYGVQWAQPAWQHSRLDPPGAVVDSLLLTVQEGRVADELVLKYPEGATTTLTLWHGSACRVEVEHYVEEGAAGFPDSATLDLRTTLHGKGGYAVHHRGEPVRYRPHASRKDSTVYASGALAFRPRGTEAAHLHVRFEPAMYVSVLPRGAAVHLDTTLHPQEGFAVAFSSEGGNVDGPGAPSVAEGIPHLLVVAPAGQPQGWGGRVPAHPLWASEGFPNATALRPPAPLVLVRVREAGRAGRQSALLLTYRNPSQREVVATLTALCALPRCASFHVYPTDHFGRVRCSAAAKPPLTLGAPAGAYTSALLSPDHALCA
eukprot:TRINITY_DN2190_c0_g1_i2.p1 TRINITY_DN2190_c0_g1~~TRINITY_DN2190_c0_g1_i2.p1  ORF type:complete len:1020 (+),score=212.20 TRINITY_DN2190_c0_g1_i2:823-3882(+)